MKILHVIPFLTPSRGGSVVVPYHLSKELAKRGHKVTIITSDFEYSEDYAQSLKIEGIEVIPFKCLANLGLYLYSPGMKLWLIRNLKNFDVIHLHNFRSYQNNLVHKYSKKYKIPYVLQAHGSIPIIIEKKNWKKIYDIIWGYKILKDASYLFSLTNKETDQYRMMNVNKERIICIPNGIDRSEFNDLPENGSFRSKYKINPNDRIILSLGRIHKIKGLDLLINAFSELLKKEKNLFLAIVGPDEGYTNILNKLIEELNISDKVLLAGPLYGRDKLEAYIDAYVYVLPSSYEIYSLTALEACACGTPVIMTDRCGIAEYISKLAYIIKYDKNELTEALLDIIRDNNLRDSLGAESRRKVIVDFDWTKIAANVEDIYEKIR